MVILGDAREIGRHPWLGSAWPEGSKLGNLRGFRAGLEPDISRSSEEILEWSQDDPDRHRGRRKRDGDDAFSIAWRPCADIEALVLSGPRPVVRRSTASLPLG